MYLGHGLFPLALLSTCVSAFYPYHAGGDDPPPGKRDVDTIGKRSPFYPYVEKTPSDDTGSKLPSLQIRRNAPDVSSRKHVLDNRANSASLQINLPAHIQIRQDADATERRMEKTRRRALMGRDNAYPRSQASTPTSPNSVAIDQDGTDYTYFSTVKFGSSGKEMWMLVDTGAPQTWVFGSDCQSPTCLKHRTFGSKDSTTLTVTGKSWSVTYGSGGINGTVVSDTVSVAGLKTTVGFGSASFATDDFTQYPMDGILGLGRPRPNMDFKTIMEQFAQDKALKANVFGIKLWRTTDGAHDGQINFGQLDTSLFEGDIVYSPVATQNIFWEIDVEDAGFSGSKVGYRGKTAIIDTGTSVIFMPPNDAKLLVAKMPGVVASGENYHMDCTVTAPLQLIFSGVTYDIPPKDYLNPTKNTDGLCTLNIVARKTLGDTQWLVGDAFLKSVYSVFDFDKNAVGTWFWLHSLGVINGC